MTRAILWDMDGVLVNTGEAHYRAWLMLSGEQNKPFPRELFANTFGMTNGPIIQRWLGEDVPQDLLVHLGIRKEELYREAVRDMLTPLPGVVTWLRWGREHGLRQAVASSGEMANILTIVGAMGVSNYFDALVSGAFLPVSKPDPAIFLQAAASVGARPEHCLVIEDGTVGIEAARRAGMKSIGITTTHPAAKLADADRVVATLEELDPGILETLLPA